MFLNDKFLLFNDIEHIEANIAILVRSNHIPLSKSYNFETICSDKIKNNFYF